MPHTCVRVWDSLLVPTYNSFPDKLALAWGTQDSRSRAYLGHPPCLIPFEIVLQRSTYRDHVNAHLFHLKDDLWAAAGVVDITRQVAAALASLDARASAASN